MYLQLSNTITLVQYKCTLITAKHISLSQGYAFSHLNFSFKYHDAQETFSLNSASSFLSVSCTSSPSSSSSSPTVGRMRRLQTTQTFTGSSLSKLTTSLCVSPIRENLFTYRQNKHMNFTCSAEMILCVFLLTGRAIFK